MIDLLISFGDVHIRKDTWYKVGFSKFIEFLEKTLPDNNREHTEIVLPGDIVENIYLYPETCAMVTLLISTLNRKAKTIYVILGNHDYGLVYYKIKSLKPLLESLGVIVIDELSEVKTELGFELLCVPHDPSQTFEVLNEKLKQYTEKTYDCFISHRELKPMPDSTDFMDISNIKTNCFCCGHIHSHKNDNRYLGSILPNKVNEVKENDPSVLRIYRKDSKTYKDFELPVFVNIEKVFVQTSTDILNLAKKPDTFYYIMIVGNTLTIKDAKHYCELSNIPLYDCDYEEKEEDVNVSIDSSSKTKVHKLPTLEEMLKIYKNNLLQSGLTEERLQKAVNLILTISD